MPAPEVDGVALPIPIVVGNLVRCPESTVTAAVPPVVIATESAPGKYTPVLVSPVVVMEGADTDPAGKVCTPVNVLASVEASVAVAVGRVSVLSPVDVAGARIV